MAEYLSDGITATDRGRAAGAPCWSSRATTRRRRSASCGPTLSADADHRGHRAAHRAGLGNTPDFALVTWTHHATAGLVRVLVRGDFEVTVGGTRISGVGVSTWTERVLDVPAEFAVEALGAEAGDDWLPIVDGIVTAARVAVPARATSSVAVVPAPSQPLRPHR